MTITKYIGMDVHKESISIAVMNAAGKLVMECVIETKGSMLLQFIDGLRGDVHVTFEEGTWAAWLYDLLKPHVSEVVVCNPRKNALLKDGSKSDRIDARKLAELVLSAGSGVVGPKQTAEVGQASCQTHGMFVVSMDPTLQRKASFMEACNQVFNHLWLPPDC
jgi:transposase